MQQLIIVYILNRLREASTWRGIIMLIAGGWATQNPEQAEAIIPIAVALAGAIGTFMPDKKKREEVTEETLVGPLPEPKNTPKIPSVDKPRPHLQGGEDNATSGWNG